MELSREKAPGSFHDISTGKFTASKERAGKMIPGCVYRTLRKNNNSRNVVHWKLTISFFIQPTKLQGLGPVVSKRYLNISKPRVISIPLNDVMISQIHKKSFIRNHPKMV